MNKTRLDRRGVLSGSLATLLSVTSPAVGHPHGDALPIEGADEHADLRAAFLYWLNAAQGRLVFPIAVHEASPSQTDLHILGVHPAIGLSLHGHSGFTAWVEWDGVCWDFWLWLDVYPQPVAGGWFNDSLLEEYRVVHPTMKSLWQADIFEPLLDWINGTLSRATHLALWGRADAVTEAYLVRDGRRLDTNRPIGATGSRTAHLLPAHGHSTRWV